MSDTRRKNRIIIILVLLLILTVLGSFLLGRYPVSLRELIGITLSNLGFEIEASWTQAQAVAVWNIRLPRIICAALVGACLSAAGAAYQGVFRNPLASPDILGASAGAGFGAALAIYLGINGLGISLTAFAFSVLTLALAFVISSVARGERTLSLVLSGIVVSSLFQAATSYIKLIADPTDKLPAITYWLMGSLVGKTHQELRLIVLPMLIGLIPLLLFSWRLNVLTMGDDEARSMGVNASRLRIVTALCATLVTAAAVSVSGLIGWVGLVIPHMMRRICGADHRLLMPASMLGGAIFLLITDNISRSLTVTETPIGILTALIGAPVFVLLLATKGKK